MNWEVAQEMDRQACQSAEGETERIARALDAVLKSLEML